MFIAAIVEFGFIDGIGHPCIVAVLLAVAATDARVPVRHRTALLLPFSYLTALAAFLVAYYGLHTAMFGSVAF